MDRFDDPMDRTAPPPSLINEHVAEANVQVHHQRKEMSADLRKQVYQALLARNNNGILHKKDTQIIADRFDLHLRTVQRIGRRGKTQLASNVPVVVSSFKKGRVGRKAIPIDLEALRDIPDHTRCLCQTKH